MNEDIDITDDKLDLLHERLGSNFYRLQSSIMEKYGEKQLEIYFKSLDLTQGITGVMGVVAGFGFTAFTNIEHLGLFFTGEALLLSGVVTSLWAISSIYSKEYLSLVAEQSRLVNHFNVRNTLYQAILKDAVDRNKIKVSAFSALQEHDNGLMSLFQSLEQGPSKLSNGWTWWLLAIGTAVLVASFVPGSLVKALIQLFIHA